ncbi:MAG TPA: DUF4350 domain-containing protein [Bacillales bacterium]
MQRLSTNRKTWLWLVFLLLLFVVISYFFLSKKPEEYPVYVSDSPSPNGVKAIYTYLQNENHTVNRWSNSPEYLSTLEQNQLLIMVGPSFTPDHGDMMAYQSFMEKGNTLLLLKTNPGGMFGIETRPLGEKPDNPVQITGRNGQHYQAILPSQIRIQTRNSDQVLLKDKGGAIAIKREFGKGSLIVVNAPGWLTNSKILDQNHLPLVLSLLESGSANRVAILFDEYIHGATNGPSLFTVYPKWLLVCGAQAILILMLFLWFQGKRFGPVLVPREESVRFSDERIRALSAWYRRSGNYRDSLAIQADYIKFSLQEHWGIPYRKAWTDIAEYLDHSWKNQSGGEIRSFVKGISDVLQKKSINKQEYLQWSRKMDRLRKEVEEDER